jgi:hypothetical protein
MQGEDVMRNDDATNALDRDDFEGDEADAFTPEGAAADPAERVDDLDAEPDDAMLEAELGAHDVPFDAEPDESEIDDEPGDEDEDDLEVALLQELGIDLDAPDEPADLFESLAPVDEPSVDDEVAA